MGLRISHVCSRWFEMSRKTIEERLEALERDWNWAKPIIVELAKQYDLQKPRVNPMKYCKDEVDRKIISYLIDNLGAGTTEIARGIGLPNPAEVGRHLVGKRLLRIHKQSSDEGWNILNFDPAMREHPISKEKKLRAWWINLEDVNVEEFKKESKSDKH